MNCPHCGAEIPSGSAFCGHCGRSSRGGPKPPPSGIGADTILDVRSPMAIHGLTPPQDDSPQAPIGRLLSLGRGPQCSIRFAEPGVSLEHATLVREEDALVLTDLGSSNGTYVDGVKVLQARVRPGNVIRLGVVPLSWEHPKLEALAQGLPRAPVSQPAHGPGKARSSSPPPAAHRDPLRFGERLPLDKPFHLDEPLRLEKPPRPGKVRAPAGDDDEASLDEALPGRRRKVALSLLALGLGVGLGLGLIFAALLALGPEDEGGGAQGDGGASGDDGGAPRPEASGDREPLFTAEAQPLSGDLFAERLADQLTLEPLVARAAQVRLEARFAVTWPGRPGDLQLRETQLLPLGHDEVSGVRHLALLASRCAVDFGHPPAPDTDRIANLALSVGSGDQAKIFRLVEPTALPGVTKTLDLGRTPGLAPSPFWSDEALRRRYFDLLVPRRVPGGIARLLGGSFGDESGDDLVVLLFPEADHDVAALRSRGTLAAEVELGRLEAVVRAGQDRWRAVLDYSTQSSRCASSTPSTPQPGAAERARFEVGAAAVALTRLGPLLGEGPSSALALAAARALLARRGANDDTDWTLVIVDGASRSASWTDEGALTLRSAQQTPVQLSGLTRGTLGERAAARVLATVDALAATPGARLVVLTAPGRAPVGSLLLPERRLDTSAELLRRGLAPLSLDDRALLARQPTLVQAALLALQDEQTAAQPGASDPTYRQQLLGLVP